MAAPVTQKFEQMTLEISEDGGTIWKKICGIVGVTVTRSTNYDSTEVPADCDDESLALVVEKQPRSKEVSVSGEGSWAQSSHELVMDWFYGGTTLKCRIGNQNAASGDTQYETGDAYLSSLTNQRTKGQKVTASVQIDFDGLPTRTAMA
ncbi:phage tail protein [Sedimentimonas flavescens]|uniref:Phage tail protein n=1 Tax=Sedimentimonas flavescens TaxID=2851012 RepID=A0ABT2ZVE0_9RHOB|nr:phage tail protein [Sedimentimonas flavescens]MCV2877611.1 phage tail protein [Sedimentimonas flavescens]